MDQSNWAVIRISGPDRVKSLNNMCTQDIKRMIPGQSSETFITNLQGKTIGFCSVHMFQDEILIRSNPESLEQVLKALDKYAIFDDSKIEEITNSLDQLALIGDLAISPIFKFLKIESHETLKSDVADFSPVYSFPDPSTGLSGIVVMGKKGLNQKLVSLIESQATALSFTEYNRLRVLNTWPNYNQDIRPDNLPQEIDRDKTAIHFNKGCYLGQETVARLDALGHVNRILMGFIWEPSSQSITPESAINQVILNQMEQQVGEIRSATIGPKAGQILGLAMIRIKSLELSPYISEDPRGSLNFMKLEEFRTQFQSVE
jgi:folate-binding protein YgfZ